MNRRQNRRRRRWFATALTATALTLAGCANSDEVGSPESDDPSSLEPSVESETQATESEGNVPTTAPASSIRSELTNNASIFPVFVQKAYPVISSDLYLLDIESKEVRSTQVETDYRGWGLVWNPQVTDDGLLVVALDDGAVVIDPDTGSTTRPVSEEALEAWNVQVASEGINATRPDAVFSGFDKTGSGTFYFRVSDQLEGPSTYLKQSAETISSGLDPVPSDDARYCYESMHWSGSGEYCVYGESSIVATAQTTSYSPEGLEEPEDASESAGCGSVLGFWGRSLFAATDYNGKVIAVSTEGGGVECNTTWFEPTGDRRVDVAGVTQNDQIILYSVTLDGENLEFFISSEPGGEPTSIGATPLPVLEG